MNSGDPAEAQPATASPTGPLTVTVRFWASARAAAGADTLIVSVPGPVTLAELVGLIEHAGGSDRLFEVLAACSVLIGDQPAGRRDRAEIVIPVGATVEFLPPFAGG